MKKIILLTYLMLHSVLVFAADINKIIETGAWQLIKDDSVHKIKVYGREENKFNYRTFKAEAILNAPLDHVLQSQLDIANYPKWVWSAIEAKVLKKVADNEFYYHLVSRTPLIPNRDTIVHTKINPYTQAKPSIELIMQGTPDYYPPQKDMVRVKVYQAVIKLTPQGDQTLINYQGYIELGDDAPAWALNNYQKLAPHLSMLGLRRLLQSSLYKNKNFPSPLIVR